MRIGQIGGHPVEQYTSPNQGGSMTDRRGIVAHKAQGTYRGTISWQMNPDQRWPNGQKVTTCSTWIVGKVPGEVAQMVDTTRVAWCQQEGSQTWWSIEFAGYASEGLTPWQVRAAAEILVAMHVHYGTAVAIADHPGERGLGHHSMDREWLGEEWGHEACPGERTIAAKADIVTAARLILDPPAPVVPPKPKRVGYPAALRITTWR